MHAPGVIKTLHSFQLPTSVQLEIFHFIEGVTWKMITFSFDKKLPSYFFASFITWYLDSNFISSGCPYNTTHFARIVFQNIKDSCKNVLLIVIRNNDFAWVILMVFSEFNSNHASLAFFMCLLLQNIQSLSMIVLQVC